MKQPNIEKDGDYKQIFYNINIKLIFNIIVLINALYFRSAKNCLEL